MILALALALATVTAPAAEVTLSAAVVDAVGEQQVIVKVAKPSMVHIAVDSAVGTACTMVDHLRGPFLDNGEVGKTSCVVDVLVDSGIYKLRLHSPAARQPTVKTRTKTTKPLDVPQAKITATAFIDLDANVPTTLRAGENTTVSLAPATQITRWFKVAQRQQLHLDVVGRSVGDVRVWRDGAFVEDLRPTTTVVRGESGRPRWRHTFNATIDAGEYAVVAYGTNPQRFSTGADDDTAQLMLEFAGLPDSDTVNVVLPAWGYATFGAHYTTALLEVIGAASDDVTLSGQAVMNVRSTAELGRNTDCTVTKGAVRRGCTVVGYEADDVLGAVWEIRGPAGTRVRLLTVPTRPTPTGLPSVGVGRSEPAFALTETSTPVTDLAVVSLPVSTDDPPLSCALQSVDDKGNTLRVLAVDAPKLGWTQAWQRRFNVDAGGTSLWFVVERAGVYGLSTDAKRGASCDVYVVENGNRRRVAGAEGSCNTRVPLPAGLVEISLSGGTAGIEQFRIGQVGLAAMLGTDAEAPPHTACVFSTSTDAKLAGALTFGRYRVSTSTINSGNIVGIYDLGENAQSMANVVTVDPGRTVRVPLPAGPTVLVNALGAAGLPVCAIGGITITGCVAGERNSNTTLTLTNSSSSPQPVVISRQAAFRNFVAAPPFSATAVAVPVIAAGTPRFFDLSQGAPKKFLVDVAAAGLYDLQTQGLLATNCVVRTATTASLFSGDRNGRGRNCHVEAWLKPGRYLVEVNAVGPSSGRAGLNVVARPSIERVAFAAGDQRFVTVPAGQLITHALNVKRDGPVDFGVTTFAGELRCRLDDDDGWPVAAVPHSCELDQSLNAGRYTLVVLPLNVDSQRALKLLTKTTAAVVSGKSTHTIALNTPTSVVLDSDGSDRLRFVLAADVDVGIVLSGGMQGRLRRQNADGSLGDVEKAVAPAGGGFSIRSSDEDSSGDEASGEEGSGDQEDDEAGEEGEEGEEGGGDEGSSEDGNDDSGAQSRATLQAAAVHRAPAAPNGQPLSLTAGTWILETEHSRGDVGITYTVAIATSTLIPGVRLAVQAPAVIDVLAPAGGGAGLVRIKTHGATDVACRLVDDNGAVVATSQGSGDDWNCALAVPLAPGSHHTLFVDAEVLIPGATEVTAEFLDAKSTGPLADGNAFRVIGKVAAADVVPVLGQLTSIDLVASEGVFSCAIFDHDGRVLDAASGVKRCPLLVWPADDARAFSVLMWTADRPASIKARVQTRSPARFGPLDNHVVDDNRVGEAAIDNAGRFSTAPNARCLPKKMRGALLPCGTSIAVDPKHDGNAILVAVAPGEKATVSFAEIIVDPASPSARDARRLTGHVDVERQRTTRPSLHLVEVAARAGSSSTPACGIDGGARVVEGQRCFAASSVGTESQLRLWTRAGAAVDTIVVRQAVELPSTATTVPTDTTTLNGTTRYAMPEAPFRLDAALPADAWAVLVDASNHSVDLCAPAAAEATAKNQLRRCVLRGHGGSVVVHGNGAARFDLLRFAVDDEPARQLVDRREVVPRMPGRERLQIAASTTARVVRVEGAGILGCTVIVDDGDRRDGCVVNIAAGRAAEVVVEHDDRAWRALLGTKSTMAVTRLGPVPSTTGVVSPNLAVPLRGAVVAQHIELKAPALVRIRATGGVCGVVENGTVVSATGFGRGCDLPVRLAAGRHVVVVRGFGGGALGGSVVVSTDSIAAVREGVGDEVLLLPGEARLLRVSLVRDGELGIGIQVDAEVLQCDLLDGRGDVVAAGCQLFGRFKKGDYTLRISVDAKDGPRRFRPVVFGLQGAEIDVPDSFLEEFFRRVPRPQPPSSSSPSASSSSSSASSSSSSAEVR